jgi:flagellar hook-associated protein 3 FlgL
MNIRITDSSLSSTLANRVNVNRNALEVAQERVSSGKRINRPSDDPFGAEAVLRLRTSQATLEQFQQNAAAVRDGLLVADAALDSHQQLLDRAKYLLTQGASDTTSAASRYAIASEMDLIRQAMLGIANNSSNGSYVFGGTRQNAAPFDSTGTPAAALTSQQMVQIEPGAAPIAAGVTAENIFTNGANTVFASLANVAAALRGTGNPAADKATILSTLDELTAFSGQATNARTQIGANLNAVDDATNRMDGELLSDKALADKYESADLAEASVQLTQADRAYQATLQATALTNRRSLLDFLG